MGSNGFRNVIRYHWHSLLYKLQFNRLWNIYSIPNYTWFKARDMFKRPVCQFYRYKKGDEPYICDLCISNIDQAVVNMSDFDWKTKFGQFRFEWLPYLLICVGKWRLLWVWDAPYKSVSQYYEVMLEYLYTYHKDIYRVRENYGWKTLDFETNEWKSSWDESFLKINDYE